MDRSLYKHGVTLCGGNTTPRHGEKQATGRLRWYKGELQQEIRETKMNPFSHYPAWIERSEWEVVPTVEDDDAED